MANILILLQEHYPQDTRVRKEVQALLENGHTITLICLRDDGQFENEKVNGVSVMRLGVSKKRASSFRYLYEYFTFFFLTFFLVKKLVKFEKFDIVHVHTIPDFLIFAAQPAKRRGAKLILDMHEIMPEFFMSKYQISENHPIIWLLKRIEKESIEYADRVITVNKQLKSIFQARSVPRHEIVEIMNTVSDEVMPRMEKTESAKFIAIYHGTLTNLYNLDFAIRSVSLIADKLGSFEFHIYGAGPELKRLEDLVVELGMEGRIVLHGKVGHELIPEILSRASLGILPIKKDKMSDLSFSNKLAEYVHNKIPVLSSDLSGVMHYFNSEMIFYFRDGDFNDFNQKLLHIVNSPKDRLVFAERAYQENLKISWDVMKVRLQDLVASVLK